MPGHYNQLIIFGAKE